MRKPSSRGIRSPPGASSPEYWQPDPIVGRNLSLGSGGGGSTRAVSTNRSPYGRLPAYSASSRNWVGSRLPCRTAFGLRTHGDATESRRSNQPLTFCRYSPQEQSQGSFAAGPLNHTPIVNGTEA